MPLGIHTRGMLPIDTVDSLIRDSDPRSSAQTTIPDLQYKLRFPTFYTSDNAKTILELI